MAEKKVCEQCGIEQEIEKFHRRPQKNNPECRIKICKTCYSDNLQETKRRQEELQRQQEEQRRIEEEERNRQREESRKEQRAREAAQHQWYAQQPDRLCIECKQVLPAMAFGASMYSPSEEGFAFLPGGQPYLPILRKRCEPCHEKYRQNNRQVYPLCLLCDTPTQRHEFLREYQGFHLDLIKVCCKQCIPRFEALPEAEQMEWLRQAIVAAYGKTAYIYGLQYREDDNAEKALWAQFKNSFFCHHIGRTKHLLRRMAEYRQKNWYREIRIHHVLEHLPFGGLSMERESRWMMHALKRGWPIDNFELLRGGEDGLSGKRQQEKLTEAIAHFEPLTAPFEVIEPLLREFLNTTDARIVHWYLERVKVV